jgi:cation diffusion facilitator family transporter
MEHVTGTAPSTIRTIGIKCLLLNCLLAGIKILCGLAGNSHSVVADGVHTLSDALTDMALITGTLFWGRPPDHSHPYGHRRIETLITGAIGAALFAVALGIAWQALGRLHEGPQAPPGLIAFAAALLSIIVKETMYHWSSAAGRRLKSTALTANAWHQRSDALSSLPVAVAVAANIMAPSLWFIDSLAALLVSVMIIKAAWEVALPALKELMDAGADERYVDRISSLALQVEGVRQVHAVRTRYVAGNMLVDLHVLVDPDLSVRDGHAIAQEVEHRLLEADTDIIDVLVHIEPFETRDMPA